MTGTLRDLTVNRDGTQNVTVTVSEDFSKSFDALKAFPVNVEIKKASKSRTLTQNAFMWALCSDIGKAIKPPLSKDDVYRRAIKAVGVWWEKEVPIFYLDTIRRRWESAGTGWFMEVVDNGQPGRKIVKLYFGTSTYTRDELKVLSDWLVDEAEQLDLTVPVGQARADLYKEWGLI